MLTSRVQLPPIQEGNTDVVMIIGGSHYGSRLLVDLFFARADQDLRTVLNFRLVGIPGAEKLFGMDSVRGRWGCGRRCHRSPARLPDRCFCARREYRLFSSFPTQS